MRRARAFQWGRFPSDRIAGAWAQLAMLSRRHWMLVLVLGLAVALRLAVAVAYRPALLWSDSWNYLWGAYSETPVRILPEKPVGYPLLLRIVGGPDRSLTLITAVQHLSGLATGVILYALLVRLRVNRLLAAVAGAIVLLDSYAVALEQHVMPESFFALALVASMYLATLAAKPTGGSLAAGASGMLLAGAVTMRVVAIYAVPAWLLYLVWSRIGWRPFVAGLVALAMPLLAYSALHGVMTGQFGMLEMDGYSIYARIGQIADCRGLSIPAASRRLCPKRQPPAERDPVDFYLYDPRSPALRTFGDPFSASRRKRAVANGRLREFSAEIIRARPLAFAELLGGEFLRFFRPGAMSTLPGYDDPILLPERPRPIRQQFQITRAEYYPDYIPRVHAPAGFLVQYGRWVHTPRWLLAVFSLGSLLAVLLGTVGRLRIQRRREILLLGGTGLSLLLGAVTAHFEPRYLIPAVPLLVGAGVISMVDLADASRPLVRRPRPRSLRASLRTGWR
jgi:hypothetical protein